MTMLGTWTSMIEQMGIKPDPSLPDLDWFELYGRFGLGQQLKKLLSNEVVREALDNTDKWVIPVLHGITHNHIVDLYRQQSKANYFYDADLDRSIVRMDRSPEYGSYVVTVRRTFEADPDQALRHAEELSDARIMSRSYVGRKYLRRRGINPRADGITLLEYMLLDQASYFTTGQYLDTSSITLCSGSRYTDGRIACAYTFKEGTTETKYISKCKVRQRSNELRARIVTELNIVI